STSTKQESPDHIPVYSPTTFPVQPITKWNSSLVTGSAHESLSVNRVEGAFMPLRSMLFPSQTANATGTDIPALNCVSFASPVSNARFTTTRQVGPVYPPPLTEPDGSHTP